MIDFGLARIDTEIAIIVLHSPQQCRAAIARGVVLAEGEGGSPAC
jgi:hypothetical protein